MNGLPVILARRDDAAHCELELVVEAANPWFEGHFPGQAILPGVVQIGWAVHYACTWLNLAPEVQSLEQVKFRRPILPGTRLTLHLSADAARHRLRYEYRDAEYSFSSGVLAFKAAP